MGKKESFLLSLSVREKPKTEGIGFNVLDIQQIDIESGLVFINNNPYPIPELVNQYGLPASNRLLNKVIITDQSLSYKVRFLTNPAVSRRDPIAISHAVEVYKMLTGTGLCLPIKYRRGENGFFIPRNSLILPFSAPSNNRDHDDKTVVIFYNSGGRTRIDYLKVDEFGVLIN